MESSVRKRLVVFSCLSSMLSFIFSGLDVLYTTFAIHDIQIGADELSLMRSLRLLLSVFIVFIVGSYVNRIGNKRIVIVSIVLLSLSIISVILFPTKPILYLAFPLYGALNAALLVNMNIMAQDTTKPYLEISNTTYRSTSIAFSILGPLAVGLLAGSDNRVVFAVFTGMLGLSILIAWGYSSGAASSPVSRSSGTFREIAGQWQQLFKHKPFMFFALITGFLNQLGMINLVLIPFKLMENNQVSEEQYSYLIALNAVCGLIFTLAAGYFLKKHINSFLLVPYVVCMAGNIAMGLFSNTIAVSVLFILTNAIYFMAMAPHSLWISSKITSNLGTAFSLAKMISSLIGFVLTLLLALLQPYLGIDKSLIVFCLSGLILCFFLYVFLFREEKTEEVYSGM